MVKPDGRGRVAVAPKMYCVPCPFAPETTAVAPKMYCVPCPFAPETTAAETMARLRNIIITLSRMDGDMPVVMLNASLTDKHVRSRLCDDGGQKRRQPRLLLDELPETVPVLSTREARALCIACWRILYHANDL